MRWLSTSRRIQMSTIAFTTAPFTTTSRTATAHTATARTAAGPTAAGRTADDSARPAPRLRITRRGRVALGALLAAPIAVALAVSALSIPPPEAGSTVSTANFDHNTVAAGESLWELAAWIAPDADPRQVVSDLVALNQLPSTAVQPGQRLAIPSQYSE
jgi:LysM repeat protein